VTPKKVMEGDQLSDDEATRLMNEALRRALTTPPKPHSDMKLGKRKNVDVVPKNGLQHREAKSNEAIASKDAAVTKKGKK
jgi:hypothetical protein